MDIEFLSTTTCLRAVKQTVGFRFWVATFYLCCTVCVSEMVPLKFCILNNTLHFNISCQINILFHVDISAKFCVRTANVFSPTGADLLLNFSSTTVCVLLTINTTVHHAPQHIIPFPHHLSAVRNYAEHLPLKEICCECMKSALTVDENANSATVLFFLADYLQ